MESYRIPSYDNSYDIVTYFCGRHSRGERTPVLFGRGTQIIRVPYIRRRRNIDSYD